jgi:hypothetical protein
MFRFAVQFKAMARSSNLALKISPKAVERRGGLVVLPLKEYQRLLASVVPTYYLKGKSATKLDRLVEKGLQEYQQGKTRAIRSLADLDSKS